MKSFIFLLCFLFAPLVCNAQIYPGPIQNQSQFKSFTANLAQNAGTYTLATASADMVIKSISTFVATAPTGLTSITVQSNNATGDIILASTLLATMTAGKNLTPVSLPFVLPSTKLLTYTIVGNGTGTGALTVIVELASPTGGTLN